MVSVSTFIQMTLMGFHRLLARPPSFKVLSLMLVFHSFVFTGQHGGCFSALENGGWDWAESGRHQHTAAFIKSKERRWEHASFLTCEESLSRV